MSESDVASPPMDPVALAIGRRVNEAIRADVTRAIVAFLRDHPFLSPGQCADRIERGEHLGIPPPPDTLREVEKREAWKDAAPTFPKLPPADTGPMHPLVDGLRCQCGAVSLDESNGTMVVGPTHTHGVLVCFPRSP